VSAEADWKYLVTNASPAQVWKTSNFNDTDWPSGRAELGYGNNYATYIGYGPDPWQKYITTYFRKEFTVADPGAFTNLILGLKRDDGAIIYLNGKEVWRDNMPQGAVSYETLASRDVSGGDETTFFQNTISNRLVRGPNLLAVELHQASPSSDDLGFDLTLTGNGPCPPIALGARTAGSSIVFSWPDTPGDYLLHSGNPWLNNLWLPVANQDYSFSNGQVQAIVEPSGSNQLFRLKRGN